MLNHVEWYEDHGNNYTVLGFYQFNTTYWIISQCKFNSYNRNNMHWCLDLNQTVACHHSTSEFLLIGSKDTNSMAQIQWLSLRQTRNAQLFALSLKTTHADQSAVLKRRKFRKLGPGRNDRVNLWVKVASCCSWCCKALHFLSTC